MHLAGVRLLSDAYPNTEKYPFSLEIFRQDQEIAFDSPVTFFLGENGTGKTTLLKAITRKCGIHIWSAGEGGRRFENNPWEERLYDFIRVSWADGPVHGSYFGSEMFRDFARILDEWAAADPGILNYFGGKSLLTQSHGQSLMSYFSARYRIKGLYFMDEPETALSPRRQLELIKIIKEMSQDGHAQFIIATHSPILLAFPGAAILSFNQIPIGRVAYESTDYFTVYKEFLNDPGKFLD